MFVGLVLGLLAIAAFGARFLWRGEWDSEQLPIEVSIGERVRLGRSKSPADLVLLGGSDEKGVASFALLRTDGEWRRSQPSLPAGAGSELPTLDVDAADGSIVDVSRAEVRPPRDLEGIAPGPSEEFRDYRVARGNHFVAGRGLVGWIGFRGAPHWGVRPGTTFRAVIPLDGLDALAIGERSVAEGRWLELARFGFQTRNVTHRLPLDSAAPIAAVRATTFGDSGVAVAVSFEGGRAPVMLLTFDGQGWRAGSLRHLRSLAGIAAASPDELWLLGRAFETSESAAPKLHAWDGSAWSTAEVPHDCPQGLALAGRDLWVWGCDATVAHRTLPPVRTGAGGTWPPAVDTLSHLAVPIDLSIHPAVVAPLAASSPVGAREPTTAAALGPTPAEGLVKLVTTPSWALGEARLFPREGPAPAVQSLLKLLAAPADESGTPVTEREFRALLQDPRANVVYRDELDRAATPPKEAPAARTSKPGALVDIFLRPSNLQAAREFLATNAEALERAHVRHGVTAQDITSVLLWQSMLGRKTGEYQIVSVLLGELILLRPAYSAALEAGAVDPGVQPHLRKLEKTENRAARTLAAMLRGAKAKAIDPLDARGTWGGGAGVGQFTPSGYRWLEDGDADGRIAFDDVEDAIMSVANCLDSNGYRQDRKRGLLGYNPGEEWATGVMRVADELTDAQPH